MPSWPGGYSPPARPRPAPGPVAAARSRRGRRRSSCTEYAVGRAAARRAGRWGSAGGPVGCRRPRAAVRRWGGERAHLSRAPGRRPPDRLDRLGGRRDRRGPGQRVHRLAGDRWWRVGRRRRRQRPVGERAADD
ncbi:hypothetical protein [Ornithinimicrobium kibberense]|uniref:hypothetical protein n=1 Tax=Ornithinimicrobium kibberense TaxID=282060 RepID=UPI0036072408